MIWVDVESCHVDDEGFAQMRVSVNSGVIESNMSECLDSLCREYGLAQDADVEELRSICGDEGLQDAVTRWFANCAAQTAVASLDAPVACSPEAKPLAQLKEGQDFSLDVRVYQLPHASLSSIEPICLSTADLSVPSDLIDEEMDKLAKSHSTRVEVRSDRAVQMGDVVMMRSDISCAGVPVSALSRDDVMLRMQPGSMPDAFLSELCGMHVGQEKRFSFDAPHPSKDGELASYDAAVEIKSLYELQAPTITDEWVRSEFPGMPDIATLREALAGAISKNETSGFGVDRAVDNAIMDRLEVDLPRKLIDFAVNRAEDELLQHLTNTGTTIKQYLDMKAMSYDDFREKTEAQTVRSMRLAMTLDAVFEAAGLSLGNEDITDTIAAFAPGDVASVKNELILAGQMPLIEEQAKRDKAHKWLVETAVMR